MQYYIYLYFYVIIATVAAETTHNMFLRTNLGCTNTDNQNNFDEWLGYRPESVYRVSPYKDVLLSTMCKTYDSPTYLNHMITYILDRLTVHLFKFLFLFFIFKSALEFIQYSEILAFVCHLKIIQMLLSHR